MNRKIAHKVIASFFYKRFSFDYSSVQCNFPLDIADKIYEWGMKNIPTSELAANGREGNIHVTVKYGLHQHDPFALRPFLIDRDHIEIILRDISFFESNDYDVVKINIESPGLIVFNKQLSDHFDHTDTHPDYNPHVTIAYVQKGKGKKYDGRQDFNGQKVILKDVLFSGNDNRETIIPFGQKT
jgi:2'-5' RNA ligase